jgi:hypothetical protein
MSKIERMIVLSVAGIFSIFIIMITHAVIDHSDKHESRRQYLSELCKNENIDVQKCERAWRLFYNENSGRYTGLTFDDVIILVKK